ncbi:MAG: hypothetical protein AAF251_07835 [Pseudomonadota bacterium]
MLFSLALGLQWAAQRLPSPAARVIASVGLLGVIAMVWIELAVDGVSKLLS